MDCNVIKDLMPLYIEKLASEESKVLVEEHVKTCEDCRHTLKALQAEILEDNQEAKLTATENIPPKLIKRIKRNFYEKILGAVLITLILGVMIGAFSGKLYRFIAFIGSISIMTFTIAIFISLIICRKKSSLRKRFKALGNWTFLLSIVMSILFFFIFSWYFDENVKKFFHLVLVVLYNIIFTLSLRLYAKFKLPKEEIIDDENPLNKKLFIVAFSTLIFIIALISAPAYLLEANKNVDNINLAFVEDPQILGKWTTVDLVSSPEKFKVDKRSWTGDFFVKGIDFLENGKLIEATNKYKPAIATPNPWLLWTKGFVLSFDGSNTANKYDIREIQGSRYMFLQWKNGDYTYFHQKPSYYVLKKVVE